MQQIMQHLMCIHLECENAIRQSQGLGLFSWIRTHGARIGTSVSLRSPCGRELATVEAVKDLD